MIGLFLWLTVDFEICYSGPYRSGATWPFSILKAIESARWVVPDSFAAATLPLASIVLFGVVGFTSNSQLANAC